MTMTHHAARASDPASSKEAVVTRSFRWDSMNGLALQIFYRFRGLPGLTHWAVQAVAESVWGKGALGKSPWKRSGELRTDFDPPLIEVARFPDGEPRMAPGEFGDPVEMFRITDAGIRAYRAIEQ